ncbi:MAG: hypothetical protein KBD01_15910 [Acidobacteria bacterium]|nr:hypothetical protein [Acidobacteriota bacterium]
MTQPLRSLVPVVVLLVVGLPALAAPKDARDWVEARSAHFRVVGDSRAHVEDLAGSLELFRDVLEKRGHSLALEHKESVLVLVVPDERSFRAQAGGDDAPRTPCSGIAVVDAEHPAILVNRRDPEEDTLSTAYRAYIHLVLGLGESYPAWFREGLAEYYRSFGMTGSTVLIGRPLRHHLVQLRRYTMMPVAELLALKDETLGSLPPNARAMFTAESWLLVHSYFTSGFAGKQRIGRLLEQQAKGTEPDAAARAALGLDTAALQRELRDYAGLRRHAYVGIAYAADRVDTKVRQKPIDAQVAFAAFAQCRSTGKISEVVRRPSLGEFPVPVPAARH